MASPRPPPPQVKTEMSETMSPPLLTQAKAEVPEATRSPTPTPVKAEESDTPIAMGLTKTPDNAVPDTPETSDPSALSQQNTEPPDPCEYRKEDREFYTSPMWELVTSDNAVLHVHEDALKQSPVLKSRISESFEDTIARRYELTVFQSKVVSMFVSYLYVGRYNPLPGEVTGWAPQIRNREAMLEVQLYRLAAMHELEPLKQDALLRLSACKVDANTLVRVLRYQQQHIGEDDGALAAWCQDRATTIGSEKLYNSVEFEEAIKQGGQLAWELTSYVRKKPKRKPNSSALSAGVRERKEGRRAKKRKREDTEKFEE